MERSVGKAARCFREAGNSAELQEVAALRRQFAEVSDADLQLA